MALTDPVETWSDDDITEGDNLAGMVVNKLAKKYRNLAKQDLKQLAWKTLLESRKSWSPDGGAGIRKYCFSSMTYAVRDSMMKNTSIVHVPKAHRVDAFDIERVGIGEDTLVTEKSTDDIVADCAWHIEVLSEMLQTFARIKDGDLARDVLLKEYTPAEVAKRRGVEAKRVYSATSRGRLAIENNYRLYKLWRDKPR